MIDDNKRLIKLWAVRIILIALIVLWMGTIFGFSSENGEQSQSLSDKITIKVVHVLNDSYDMMEPDQQQDYFNTVSFFVRKTGHFGEYGILGVLIAALLMTFEKIRKIKKEGTIPVLLTAIIGMLYAATDEFHQGFVDGRSPKVMDVCIDTAGTFTGALFLTMIWLLIFRRKRKNVGKQY